MLGIFALGAIIGTPLYAGRIIKNDIQAETIDRKFKPSLNQQENRKNIRINFKNICKRCGIKLSQTGKPINKNQCKLGKEYLAYQGYDDDAIKYFETLYLDYFNDGKRGKRAEIDIRHQRLLHKFEHSQKPKILITYRRHYYGDNDIKDRMSQIYDDNLWNKLVSHYTYIKGNGSTKYIEIWTLKVPNNLFNNMKIDTIYEDICYKLNIENSNF